MGDEHDGGCLCGALRYRVIGDPARSNVCHCRFCQRLTGSAFLVEPIFPKTQVSYIAGRPMTYAHVGEHGRRLSVHFCGHCSTKVGLTFERFPDHVGVCGGTFDDPTWFPILRHIFTESAVPWIRYPADVDCFSQHAIDAHGAPTQPWQRRSGRPS